MRFAPSLQVLHLDNGLSNEHWGGFREARNRALFPFFLQARWDFISFQDSARWKAIRWKWQQRWKLGNSTGEGIGVLQIAMLSVRISR